MNALGIDFGGTKIKAALVDNLGMIQNRTEIFTQAELGREAILANLQEIISRFSDYDALGVGMPGPFDDQSGVILNPPNLKSLHGFNILKFLTDIVKKPIALDRDSNCALIAEHWIGVAKGLKNVVMLTWGTGVGGAVITDGKIYRGKSDMAGELGHMIIDPNGDKCPLGHQGCLESFIGGLAIERRFGQTLENIVNKARDTQLPSEEKKIVKEIGDYLKLALDNIRTIFDPELILISGSGAKSIDLFMEEIKDFPIQITKKADDAGIIGAGRIALDKLGVAK